MQTVADHTEARACTPVRPVPAAVDWHMGALMTWHITAAETGGLLSLGEVVVRQGGEPPLHVHAREDEAWFILEGEILFQRGHERILAGAGDAVVLPRGIPHGFAVQSAIARILHTYTPGGLEHAFRAVSLPAPERVLPPVPAAPPGAETRQRLERVFGDAGVTFVGPPLPVLLGGAGAR